MLVFDHERLGAKGHYRQGYGSARESCNGTGGWVNHRNESCSYVEYPFRLYYRCIGNANALIENIDNAKGPEINRNPNYVLSTNTGQVLIDEIMFRRRVDFWAEGLWKRLDLPLDRTVVPNYVSASAGGVMEIPAGDVRWQFAIPISEIQANPDTERNP